jgi:hypothetical protein
VTESALLAVARREIENDGFNRLTPLAALPADDVLLLRAYAKYLKQAAFPFSQPYIEQTLAAHPAIARKLAALFHARFEPGLPATATRCRRRSPTRSRRSWRPCPTRMKTASCAAAGPHPRHAAHQPLGARREGAAQAVRVVQAALGESAGAAGAAPALRGVGLFAALRGDPPARRQGRPRRAALVRPPEDFRTEILGW